MGNNLGRIREITADCRNEGKIKVHDPIRARTRDKQVLYDKVKNPKYYMSSKEKSDYNAALHSSDTTPAQKFAVYVYKQANKFINQGYSVDALAEELQRKRIRCFLTRQEKKDADAATHSSDRTAAQQFAVYVYDQAKKFLDKGYCVDALTEELQRKRICYFLTRQEKKDADAAFHSSDRTAVQKFAVYVYNQAEKLINQGYSADAIAEKLERKRIRYFSIKQEKQDYNVAPSIHEKRDPTDAQYEQVRKILEEGSHFDWHEINQQIQSAPESIYEREEISLNYNYKQDTHNDYNTSFQSSLMGWLFGPHSHLEGQNRVIDVNPSDDNTCFHEWSDVTRLYFENPRPATPIPGKSSVYQGKIPDGCAIDATMMLLHDQNIYGVTSEKLAHALNYTPEDGVRSYSILGALERFGSVPYERTSKDTIADLQEVLKSGYSCASALRRPGEVYHLVVVDKIGKDSRGNGPFVYIRESNASIPYKVTINEWKRVWKKDGNVTPKIEKQENGI